MRNDKDQDKKNGQQPEQTRSEQPKQRSSAFNEASRGDEKSTSNIEEEADLEQQRKETLTERD
jgi:hypothetical protein